MRHLFSSLLLSIITTALLQAQGFQNCGEFPNPININTPFLVNPVDARSGAMGYTGVANSKGAAAQYFNSAQLAFSENKLGLTLSARSPIIESQSNIYLYGAGYYQIDGTQTIGFSYHRNHIGEETFHFEEGSEQYSLGEFAISGSYNRKITENFAIGLGLKYIRSNLFGNITINGQTSKPAGTYAGDFSLNYHRTINLSKGEALMTFGSSISNLGRKISYSPYSYKLFLPANLGLGLGFNYRLNPKHSFNFAFDINKYLVPSSYNYYYIDIIGPYYDERSVIDGAMNSLWDAPCGFREKVQENMYAIGIEYQFKNLSLRAGHYNSHQYKDDIKAITAGIGYDFSHFSANVSYAHNISKSIYYIKDLKPVYQATITFDLMTIN